MTRFVQQPPPPPDPYAGDPVLRGWLDRLLGGEGHAAAAPAVAAPARRRRGLPRPATGPAILVTPGRRRTGRAGAAAAARSASCAPVLQQLLIVLGAF